MPRSLIDFEKLEIMPLSTDYLLDDADGEDGHGDFE